MTLRYAAFLRNVNLGRPRSPTRAQSNFRDDRAPAGLLAAVSP